MKKAVCLTLVLFLSAYVLMARAGSDTGDVSTQLEDNHINIRSMLDPDVTISRLDPISIVLPSKPTIADKQLLQLIQVNLAAEGFNVTTPDKSKWTLIATVQDQSSTLTYGERGFFSLSYSSKTATLDYAELSVVICKSGDLSTPVWTGNLLTYNDFWVQNQEIVIKAILATYGIDFYYQNEKPSAIPDDVRKNDNQPPTLERIKHCLANPQEKGC